MNKHTYFLSSLATEWIKGKQLTDAAKIKNSDIAKVFLTNSLPSKGSRQKKTGFYGQADRNTVRAEGADPRPA